MRVNIAIQEDEQFRKHVKELISGQVRSILREELAGIVSGEIAKLRLLQPDSPALSTLVTTEVNQAIRRASALTETSLRTSIQQHVQAGIAQHLGTIKTTIRDELVLAIRNSIK